MEFKQIQKLLLKHIEVLNKEKMITGIPTIKITEIAKELKKELNIPVFTQSCDTCKHLSNCSFWQEAPNNGATCKFYINHVA